MKYFIFIILIFSFLTNIVSASTDIYFEVNEKVPLNQEFVISLILSNDKSINTVSANLNIPKGIKIKDVGTGTSIINFWIDKPVYNEDTGNISFSGIIPGGFLGKGSIIKLIAIASTEGNYEINNSSIDFYLNNYENTKKTLNIDPVRFSVDKSIPKQLVLNDLEIPESFIINVAHDPLLKNDSWVAFFSTVDKSSGVVKYQIAEKPGEKEKNYKNLDWVDVESPALLKDQNLKSYVYVKAIDKAGNERIEFLEPKYPITPFDRVVFEILPLIFILLTAYIVWRLWRKQFTI